MPRLRRPGGNPRVAPLPRLKPLSVIIPAQFPPVKLFATDEGHVVHIQRAAVFDASTIVRRGVAADCDILDRRGAAGGVGDAAATPEAGEAVVRRTGSDRSVN